MSKELNAVFICRDNLDKKDSFYGFIIHEGDNPIVKEIYEKSYSKMSSNFSEDSPLTLCRIDKIKKEHEKSREILSNLYKFSVSELKSQSYNKWKLDAFGENLSEEEIKELLES